MPRLVGRYRERSHYLARLKESVLRKGLIGPMNRTTNEPADVARDKDNGYRLRERVLRSEQGSR